MASITIEGLSDEVVALLRERADERGTDLGGFARELIHLGVSLEIARKQSLDFDFGALVDGLDRNGTADVMDGLGSFDTADPDLVWG